MTVAKDGSALEVARHASVNCARRAQQMAIVCLEMFVDSSHAVIPMLEIVLPLVDVRSDPLAQSKQIVALAIFCVSREVVSNWRAMPVRKRLASPTWTACLAMALALVVSVLYRANRQAVRLLLVYKTVTAKSTGSQVVWQVAVDNTHGLGQGDLARKAFDIKIFALRGKDATIERRGFL